ncbi:hypothetical protein [Variovorax sp. J22R115]|uniref:hypothetical protein n=1 Tax=Variovorax sp. J22R115 TaxID=3053509 RepID=UPI002576104D|nr:hypothetical protein [Variovorax sp. J22R115]
MLHSGVRKGRCSLVVGERNALKQAHRDLTPAPMSARIDARTLERYGNAISSISMGLGL